jgi:hypothetical protein
MVLLASQASAQTARGDAYVIGGPGQFRNDAVVYKAAGAEYISADGVGAALEVGEVTGVATHVVGRPARSTVTTGVHVVIATSNQSRRVQPFVLAGLAYESDPLSDSSLALMFGGGANMWLGTHIGVRLDVRVPFVLVKGGGGIAAVGLVVR